MKKLFLTLIAAVAICTVSIAQKANVQSILANIEKSKTDVQDPKKGVKGSTWITFGNRLNDAATANSSSIYPGMTESEILLAVGKPGKEGEYEMVTINGNEYKKFVYPTVEVYFLADKISFWNELNPVYPNALEEATAAYLKAMEIDAKAKDKAVDGLKLTMNNYMSEANNKYTLNKFSDAAKLFLAGAKIASNPEVAHADANLYKYYGAVAAIQGNDFATSEVIFDELVKSSYLQDGDAFYYLGFAKEKMNKKEEAEKAYLAGVNQYPANQKVMNQLINYYITSGDDPAKVIPFIKKAQEADPKNHLMVFVEGIAYQNMKDFAKAHEAYNKTKAMDPTFFDAYYNDGLAYLGQADAIIVEMNKIDATNRKAYNEAFESAVANLTKSAEVFEQAHELQKTNRDVIELLKNVYFRLRETDPKYLEKYNQYSDVLKAM